MISQNVLRWLDSDESELEDFQIYKIELNDRFLAIYTAPSTEMEKKFCDLFDLKFIALFDREEKKYRIRYEDEILHRIEKAGLGEREDILYIPQKAGFAQGFKNQVIKRLQEMYDSMTEEECLPYIDIEDPELWKMRNENLIENLAVQRVVDREGLDAPSENRWTKMPKMIGSKCSLYVLENWTDDMVMDLLNGDLKADAYANAYLELNKNAAIKAVWFQKVIESKADEIYKLDIKWLSNQVDVYQTLRKIEADGGTTVQLYFETEKEVGAVLKVHMDTLRKQAYEEVWKIAGHNVYCSKIWQIKWGTKIYLKKERSGKGFDRFFR